MSEQADPRRPLRVLCLEDAPDDAQLVKELLLKAGFDVHMDVAEGRRAYEALLGASRYDIILADYNLPDFDAFAALELARQVCPATPLICVSGTIGEEKAAEIVKQGAVDYLLKDRLGRLVIAVEQALEHAAQEQARRQAEEALAESNRRLHTALFDTVSAIGAIVELRDPYTSGHERQVTQLSEAIAIELGLGETMQETLILAGGVHDIGKVGVPAEILSKPGLLSDTELRIVREHAARGRDIVAGIAFEGPVAEAVWQHHERLDGSGYPRGLKDSEIILEARIIAVADVVQAMSSHRPYRPSLGTDAALAEVRAGAGTRYDADVVDACVRLFTQKGFTFCE